MKIIKVLTLAALFIATLFAGAYINQRYQMYKNWYVPAAQPPSASHLEASQSNKRPVKSTIPEVTAEEEIFLGINTADVREDTSSIQFLNLFKSAIPFAETVPWGSSKEVEYDKLGWPSNLNGGKAGTKFLNRLPEGTIEDGFYTVLYDGEGEIFYGNDAQLIVHRLNRDIIEIKAGKDKMLNASLFITKTTQGNHINNIRILPEGGICQGKPNIKVSRAENCKKEKNGKGAYLPFDGNDASILFNPDYLDFMQDFQVIRFMNMQGMTRNPVENWANRNTPEKATWGGRAGLYSRGAPVEVMVALANQTKAHPWFSMPYKANDDYIRKFAEYVKTNLDPTLKVYIEYSNEVWNPIFIHHDYAIEQGLAAKLDVAKSPAGYKWYSRRSVEVFKIWQDAFGGVAPLVRVMGSWASNQNMSSQILAFEDAYKHTDAIAIGPYVSAHPKVLRKANNVDDVFKAMMDKTSKWGMKRIISYIRKQQKVANSFGVDLLAYEGGQHLVDWDTREVNQHPNPLLYAANRDPRMGILYDQLMNAWKRAGGKLFVAFSAPRIYSWYGSWGIKEHIRQARTDAPKYDSLLRYLENSLKPEASAQAKQSMLAQKNTAIKVPYAKNPQMIWDMTQIQTLPTKLANINGSGINNSDTNNSNINDSDISATWQANWDSKHLYFSVSIKDSDLQKGDKLTLTLETYKNAENENTETVPAETMSVKTMPAKTFSFTPFGSFDSQTQLTKTDSGYLLNTAIPWRKLYTRKKTYPSTGNEIGINITVVDVDEVDETNKADEVAKNSQTFYWPNPKKALAKLVLSH